MSSPSRIFELRTYQAAPGKFEALQDRFKNHTLALFDKHGVTLIGFWIPLDAQGQPKDSLVYLLAFDDRRAAEATWASFQADPAWQEAKAASEHDGPLTTSIDSVYLTATPYSPLT